MYLQQMWMRKKPESEVAFIVTELGFSLPFHLTDTNNLDFSFTGGRVFSDWHNRKNLKFSNGRKPWDDLNFSSASLTISHGWNKNWTSFVGGAIAVGWEEEIDDASSFTEFIGTSYQSAFNLKWTLGVGFGQEPEESGWGPFGGVTWNEDRKNEGDPGFCASIDWPPAAEVCYVVNKKWAVRLNYTTIGGTFRLADDNEVSPSGLVKPSLESYVLFVDYKPIPSLSLNLAVNYNFEHQWEIQDEDGNGFHTLYIDDAVGFLFEISWIF